MTLSIRKWCFQTSQSLHPMFRLFDEGRKVEGLYNKYSSFSSSELKSERSDCSPSRMDVKASSLLNGFVLVAIDFTIKKFATLIHNTSHTLNMLIYTYIHRGRLTTQQNNMLICSDIQVKFIVIWAKISELSWPLLGNVAYMQQSFLIAWFTRLRMRNIIRHTSID